MDSTHCNKIKITITGSLQTQDMVPEGLNKRWQNTIEQMRKLKEIVLPRCYSYSEVTNPIVKVVMHSFSDATLTALMVDVCI